MTNAITEQMLQLALDARKNAYAPYSKFFVGSCIRSTSGKLYYGCNVENASYGLTVCAEMNAVGSMIANGEIKIAEVVIIGSGTAICSPCGNCRQVLWEFGDDKMPVHLCGEDGVLMSISLGELLPYSFSAHTLEKNK